MNNALLADNNPYEALAELIESESEKVRQSNITIKSYYHQIGDHLFAKFQEFSQPGVKKKEAEKKIKQFIARTYPAKKYDADFRANISKFLKFSTKISKLDKPLQERIINDTYSWDEAAIAALLEMKPGLIPEALNNWKNSIPQGNEIRKWKRENSFSSLEMDKKFDKLDLEITQSKFNLSSQQMEEIITEAQERRKNTLQSQGIDLSVADTSILTNDIVFELQNRGFKVGKFKRYSRKSKKIYTEEQMQERLQNLEKNLRSEFTDNIVGNLKAQFPGLVHFDVDSLALASNKQQVVDFPANINNNDRINSSENEQRKSA